MVDISGVRRLSAGDIISIGEVTAVLALAVRTEPPPTAGPASTGYARLRSSHFLMADPVMASAYAACERAAADARLVLLVGERGADHGRLAETIHRLGPGTSSPYLRLRAGEPWPEPFPISGTLFVDEIGELTWALQTRLVTRTAPAWQVSSEPGDFTDSCATQWLRPWR